MRKHISIFLAALWMLIATPLQAQQPTATAYDQIAVYDGPGHTFHQNTFLAPGIEVTIVARNRVGNWVRVTRTNDRDEIILDGWVVTGYLRYESLHLSEVPVDETIADADPENAEYVVTGQLYAVPLMPTVSPSMLGVYRYGQALGNHSNVVTKIGDSVSANPFYLNPISEAEYDLGPYDFLEPTIQYFQSGMVKNSVASRIGMTTYVLFDPLWADKERCEPGETPLDCELRISKPSIAVIMFGANDVRHMTDAEFHEQMKLLVEHLLEKGVIPVLSTFSVHPDYFLWWQGINFNLRLAEIAQQYEVPLINLWAATRMLPEYGLDEDDIHLGNSGFATFRFSTGHEAWYGTSMQNLLTLRMLDELRQTLNMG